jgi:hypothetical protein
LYWNRGGVKVFRLNSGGVTLAVRRDQGNGLQSPSR